MGDYTSPSSTSTVPPLLHRACEQCNRKKTKSAHLCGLCRRTGQRCEFPTRRRKPNEKRGKSRLQRKTAQDRCTSCQSPRSESTNPAAIRSSSLSTTSASPKNPQSSLEKAPEEGAEEEIPPELAKALVDLFFLKIQPWLPLFHRPTFYQTYIGKNQTMRAMGDLSMDERLMFWAIFALAAKYYSAGDWARIPAPERGAQFAVNANQAYARLRLSASKSSEAYLKGCILLAFYLYTSCLRHQSWILTGVCVRMAFDLNLHRIDAIETEGNCGADEQQLTTRWMRKEGLRRIWWLVWELDRFGSILLQRPYAIDDRSVRVCLPVSDHDWFAGRRVGSAMLDREPHRVWNSLQGSENQSERAWFLVCNHLVSLAHASYQYPSNEEVGEIVRMETILNCFRLSLPPQFDIFENPPDFSNDDVSQYNWIICTNLLLLSARTSCDVARAQPEQMYTKRIQARASELVQIMNAWPSEYIKVCQPFVACTLLGPKSAFVDSNRGTPNPNPAEPTLAKEMARLGLAHFARHWNLASVLLDLESFLTTPDNEPASHLGETFSTFLALLPDRLRPTLSCGSASPSPSACSSSTSAFSSMAIHSQQEPIPVEINRPQCPPHGPRKSSTADLDTDYAIDIPQTPWLGLFDHPIDWNHQVPLEAGNSDDGIDNSVLNGLGGLSGDTFPQFWTGTL